MSANSVSTDRCKFATSAVFTSVHSGHFFFWTGPQIQSGHRHHMGHISAEIASCPVEDDLRA